MSDFWVDRKPPPGVGIDWGHPLASGLVACWTLAQGAGTATDAAAVAGQQGLVLQGATWRAQALNFTVTPLSFATTNTGNLLTDRPYLGPLTIVCRALVRTGAAFRAFVCKAAGNGGSNNPFDFRTTNAATPLLAFVRAAGVGFREFNGPAVTLNQMRTYAVSTPDSLCETSPTFYIDGAPTSGGASVTGTGAGPVTGANQDIRLGRRADGSTQLDGSIDFLMIWSRALSEVEHKLIAAQPYAMFAPPAWRRWFVPAVAVAGRPNRLALLGVA